jgi:uncharacterized protein with HEPN domain
MRHEDEIRLRHMLDAAGDALSFAGGRKRADLDQDRQFLLAVVKCFEIIGEAASQVSSSGQSESAALPWREMVDMRHRLVHGYYDINHDIVWSTLQEDLPRLIEALRQVLKQP